MNKNWDDLIHPPRSGRPNKPRTTGISIVLDKGLSITETKSLLENNANFIDFIKFAFGTIPLYQPEILAAKIKLATEFEIPVYPGGTFLELACWQNTFVPTLSRLKDLGIDWVEISDGTINLPPAKRQKLIAQAIDLGFEVITEVGKKDPLLEPTTDALIEQSLADLAAGAHWVIIEARESGKNIGIYDNQGKILDEKLFRYRTKLPLEKIIWEAPLKNQQADLINLFGPAVNLGNIATTDIMALEALRLGLRSDTWVVEAGS